MSAEYEPTSLDPMDRALLHRAQAGIPLAERPFALMGEVLGLEEAEVLARLRRLKEAGIVRQIGAVFDTRALGYTSTLVAWHVPDGALEAAAAIASAHPGVSHNYARPHHYNLWFTLAVPPGCGLDDEAEHLSRSAGVDDWLNLPALRVFKIRTHFDLDGGGGSAAPSTVEPASTLNAAFNPADVPVVRALQEDLRLVSHPFAEVASQAGLEEQELLARAEALQAAGILRRFGAVLHHRRVGYTLNGMACWAVPEERIEAVGQWAAACAQVSHCYQRPAYPPRWPYTLFTMIHGRAPMEIGDVVAHLAVEAGPVPMEVLYSTREFKKERVRYFQ